MKVPRMFLGNPWNRQLQECEDFLLVACNKIQKNPLKKNKKNRVFLSCQSKKRKKKGRMLLCEDTNLFFFFAKIPELFYVVKGGGREGGQQGVI